MRYSVNVVISYALFAKTSHIEESNEKQMRSFCETPHFFERDSSMSEVGEKRVVTEVTYDRIV